MAMTPAERKAKQRERARAAGKCIICCKAQRRKDKETCGPCARKASGWADPDTTPHTCIYRGGLNKLDPKCARCLEIINNLQDEA